MRQALVMVMNRDRQHTLWHGPVRSHSRPARCIFLGCRHAVARFDKCRLVFFANNVHTQFDAFIADEYRRTGNQFSNFVLAFSAERTVKNVFESPLTDLLINSPELLRSSMRILSTRTQRPSVKLASARRSRTFSFFHAEE